MTKKMITVLIVLLSMAGLAYALAELTINPDAQAIDITPSPNPIVSYTVTLNTDAPAGSAAVLQWSTDNSAILARIGAGSLTQFGTYSFTVSATQPQTFTLDATVDEALENTVKDETHEIEVDYKDQKGKIKAMVTGNISPVSELATVALVGTGLVGLVFLRRKK